MSARLDPGRFPQLADQVRTSTGYTLARGGVIRIPPPIERERTETPVIRDVSVSPKPKKKGRPARPAKGAL
jgi:hypothetical protein